MEDAIHFLSKDTVIQAISRAATKVNYFEYTMKFDHDFYGVTLCKDFTIYSSSKYGPGFHLPVLLINILPVTNKL